MLENININRSSATKYLMKYRIFVHENRDSELASMKSDFAVEYNMGFRELYSTASFYGKLLLKGDICYAYPRSYKPTKKEYL